MTTTPGGLDRRVTRIAEQVADLGTSAHPPMCVMGPAGISDDPRVAALIAVARAKGRCIVRPWSETPDGRLVDHSSPEYQRARVARADAEAIDACDLPLYGAPPVSDGQEP